MKFADYLKNTSEIVESEDLNLPEPDFEVYTKEDLIEFVNELTDEEAEDLAGFIMDELYDESEDDEDEDEDYEDDEMSEKKFFKTKKRELNRAKKVDRADRRKLARDMKKYYKKNKAKIKVKASRYRKKTKRNPNMVKTHRK